MTFSTIRPWLAGAIIAVSFAASASAQDAKALFEGRYAELSAATSARDTAALGKLMAPDFVMTDIQGNDHTAAEMQGMMGRGPGGRGPGGGGPGGDGPRGPGPGGGGAGGPGGPGAPPAADAPRPVPKITIVSAEIAGPTAKVEQQIEIHTTRPGPDGTPMKLDITVLTEDLWVQSGGIWLLKSSDQKDVSVARDGDVVFHQAK